MRQQGEMMLTHVRLKARLFRLYDVTKHEYVPMRADDMQAFLAGGALETKTI